mgnify:CR=1 FL=1
MSDKFIISSEVSAENLGELSELRTTEKGTVVRALNEVNQKTLDVIKKVNNLNFINIKDYGAKGDGVTDDTAIIQGAVNAIMLAGGGTIYFPAGEYLISGTIYTHTDSITDTYASSPLEFLGETPINFDLYSASTKKVTKFTKKTDGAIIAANYTVAKEVVTTSQWRNFTVRNIGFFGSGTYDAKYQTIMASVRATDAIELRNTSITLVDSFFWALRRGVNQPDYVKGLDNLSDQSVYRNLGFRAIGDCALRLVKSDATLVESINFKDMAKTCRQGVYVRKGEAVSIKNLHVSGKGMHLCQDFSLVEMDQAKSVRVTDVYAERVEGLLVNLVSACLNIDISSFSINHYSKTLIKARSSRNIDIDHINSFIEERKVLSSSDPGNFTVFTTLASKPVEIDTDSSCKNVSIGDNFQFRAGVHDASGALPPSNNDTYRFTPDFSSGVIVTSDTGTPSTGTWGKGSLIYNTDPGVGKPIGWVCVNAGNPGTWLPFGYAYNSTDPVKIARFRINVSGTNNWSIDWYTGQEFIQSVTSSANGLTINYNTSYLRQRPEVSWVFGASEGLGTGTNASTRMTFIYLRANSTTVTDIGLKETAFTAHTPLASMTSGAIEFTILL